LTYVTGGFALLAEELETQQVAGPSDDIRISLELIQSGTMRLNRLAEQMVLYSQIISGSAAQHVAEMSDELELEYLIGDALTTLQKYLKSRQINVHVHNANGTMLPVMGVKDLLLNALGEIIRNAAQYSH